MTYAPALASLPAELPAVTSCPLRPSPDAASKARSFTRHTLASWGLDELTDDAEVIVSELLANAVRHAGIDHAEGSAQREEGSAQREEMALGLWLLRHPDGFMCAVTDPSDSTPALKQPGQAGENGRGLHVVHALSDHWGWTPLSERGKAVWAILFRG
jgi:anti-sigma regulatory factor (Ser/Thr protein kinase)